MEPNSLYTLGNQSAGSDSGATDNTNATTQTTNTGTTNTTTNTTNNADGSNTTNTANSPVTNNDNGNGNSLIVLKMPEMPEAYSKCKMCYWQDVSYIALKFAMVIAMIALAASLLKKPAAPTV